jgi:hypothetical protein
MLRILHISVLCALAGVMVVVSVAQPNRTEQIESLLIRGVENRSRIESLESRVSQMDKQESGERLVRLETKVEQVEWYMRLMIGGMAVLIMERVWGLVTSKKRKGDAE